MPLHHLQEFNLEVNREAVLLDTNILVGFHDPDDDLHVPSEAFLNVWEGQIIVCFSVVVEAWGLLAGKRKKVSLAHEMLAWLARPDTGIDLIPDHATPFSLISGMTCRHQVDCVDALLVEFADRFSKLHNFNPALQIASFDSDYITRFYKDGYRFRILDPKTLDTFP